MYISEKLIIYMKKQEEILNNLITKNSAEKEMVLNEINQELKEMDLKIKISELNKEIVFVSAVKEKFLGKTLYSFLENIFGEEARDYIWEIFEMHENTNYTVVNKFMSLLEKRFDIDDILFSEKRKADEKGKITRSYVENLKLSGIKDIAEKELSENFFSIKNVKNKRKSENDIKEFPEKLNDFDKKEKISIQGNSAGIIGNKEQTEKELKSSEKRREAEFLKYEKYIKELEQREEELLKIINETKEFLEDKNFYEAVENVKILAKYDKLNILNEEKVKYAIEGVLLRVIRFFVPRNRNNSEHWDYFIGKNEEKAEFYANVVKLREYFGLTKEDTENHEIKPLTSFEK